MSPLLYVLLVFVPMFIWLIPLARGINEKNSSQRYEAMSDDPGLGLIQRNRFCKYALNSRKKSEYYFFLSGLVLFLQTVIFSVATTIFPIK